MFQQEGHPVLHVARVDDVVVVEYQHDIVRDDVEVVKQSDKARLVRRLWAVAGARARLHQPRARRYSARPQGTSRTTRDRCRAGQAKATPGTDRRPQRQPATPPAASSCEPAGADTRVSADSARGSGARSVADAPPDCVAPGDVELRLEQWACHDRRHLRRLTGRASRSPETIRSRDYTVTRNPADLSTTPTGGTGGIGKTTASGSPR